MYTSVMNTSFIDYKKLSIAERIQLVEDIWDSIAAEAPESFQISDAEKSELHRCVEAHRVDPSTGIPWEQVRKKLFKA